VLTFLLGLTSLSPLAPVASGDPSDPVVVAGGTSTSNLSSYPLGTTSFTAGHLYVAFIKLSETGGAVDETPGVVGGGSVWTQIDAGQASSGSMGLAAYRFSPTSDLEAVSLSTALLSTRHEGITYSIVEVATGFDPLSPIAQYRAAGSSAATSYSISLPSVPASDSLVLASLAHAANEGSTPNAGWLEVEGSDLAHLNPSQSGHVIFNDGVPSQTPGSSWSTSSRRRGIAIEISTEHGSQPPGVTLAAAGDICGNLIACRNTSDRVIALAPDVVMTLGDLAYNSGTLAQFRDKYCGSYPNCKRWGRPAIQSITLPGYGNHDCYDVPRDTGATKQGCTGAVAYFGPDSTFGTDIPGTSGSYYTVRGEWLIVQLNSAGDEGTGQATQAEIDAQNEALDELLDADTHTCEVIGWHHPRYASGDHGSNVFVDPWFETAYAHGVEVVLNGHAHSYERFLPQDDNGNHVADGVVQIVAGTGGAEPDSTWGTIVPNSVARIIDFGVLAMRLNDDATYSWAFHDDMTGGIDDQGTGACHGPPPSGV
jgi:hypothetical protein